MIPEKFPRHKSRWFSWVVDAPLHELRQVARMTGLPYGMKAEVKRMIQWRLVKSRAELAVTSGRVQRMNEEERKVTLALVSDETRERFLQGQALAAGVQSRPTVSEGICSGCGFTSELVNGKCDACAPTIFAGESLPPQEVFTRAEIRHMEFVKHLIASGRMSEEC